jgi:hypothetical protein
VIVPRPQSNLSARLLAARRQSGPVFGVSVALVCLGAGLIFLWQHVTSEVPRNYRAPAGLILILLALVQLRILSVAWRRITSQGLALYGRWLFWQWMFVGLVVCYLAALVLGPDASAGYVLAAALGGWYSLWLAPLAVHGRALESAVSAVRLPIVQKLGWLLLLAAALPTTLEASLRLYDLVMGNRTADAFVARSHRLPPGATWQGRVVNNLGYWDDEFRPEARNGLYRVAVLGDTVTLSGTVETNCLARLEYRIAGIEIYHFGLAQAGPRQYLAQLVHEVSQFDPNLVLAFISVGDDITQPLPSPGAFDWRSLRMYQMAAPWLDSPCDVPAILSESDSVLSRREDYLRKAAERMIICRTPIDEPMRQRWREALAYLDEMVEACRRRQMKLALVLVPSAFQLNDVLLAELCRRHGCRPEEFDLELPQRRLGAFAEQRGLAVLDLLPHLRAAEQSAFRRNDFRFNDRGNQLVAEALGRWLETQLADATSDEVRLSSW